VGIEVIVYWGKKGGIYGRGIEIVRGGLRKSDFLETTDDGTMREYTPGTEACQEGIRVSAERTSLTEEPYDDGGGQ